MIQINKDCQGKLAFPAIEERRGASIEENEKQNRQVKQGDALIGESPCLMNL